MATPGDRLDQEFEKALAREKGLPEPIFPEVPERELSLGEKINVMRDAADIKAAIEPLRDAAMRVNALKSKVKGIPKNINMIPWEEYIQLEYGCKCYKCPGLYANEVMKFVGFRGIETRYTHKRLKGVLRELDVKGGEYKGEVHPEPIAQVTSVNAPYLMKLTGLSKKALGRQYFIGIFKYEVEIMTLLYTLRNMGYENIMVLMPRGHGKTWMQDWESGLGMKFWSAHILMLSETDATLKVGNWLYIWSFKNGYLSNPVKKLQSARKDTYLHFTLVNGAEFDVYGFMDKRTVGMHNVRIIGDDIVNLNWRNKPTDNKKAIEHWQSALNPIIRTGLEIFGTRKFEGDPLQHIMETIEDIVIIKMSPYLPCPHNNKNDDDTFDACEICGDDILLAPEIHSHKSLKAKMYEDFEAWFAEYMQNPHPTQGGMVDEDDIIYIPRPFWKDVQAICIGVDSTESDLDSVDMCGVVSVAMLKNESTVYKDQHFPDLEDVPCFVFLDADVRKMPFRTLNTLDKKGRPITHRGIMETIGFFIEQYERQYLHVRLMIAIERQGGGIFIIKEVYNNRSVWSWFRYLIGEQLTDKKPKDLGMKEIGVRHTKEKIARVFSELRYPIKSGQVKFADNLFGNVFIQQTVTFPKGRYDDGVDAGGMAKDECAKRWIARAEISFPWEGIKAAFNKNKSIGVEGDFVFQPKGMKELEDIKKKRKDLSRGVFGG